MEANDHGVRRIMVRSTETACTFHLCDARGEHTVCAGLGDWIEGATSMTGNDLHHQYQPDRMHVAAMCRWVDDATLVMTWVFTETAFRDEVVCRFADDEVTLDRSVNVNTGALSRPTLRGAVARHGPGAG